MVRRIGQRGQFPVGNHRIESIPTGTRLGLAGLPRCLSASIAEDGDWQLTFTLPWVLLSDVAGAAHEGRSR
jgi:hypothetical protein